MTSIKARNSYTQTLNYTGSQLTSVTDSFGRSLQFSYQNGLLQTLTTPDSLVLTYGYSSSGVTAGVNDRLASVSYSTSPVHESELPLRKRFFPLRPHGHHG